MKKITLLSLLFIASQTSNAQTPNWIWAEGSGGGYYEYANGISVDTIGNLFVSGRCSGTINLGGQSTTSGGADNPFVGGLDTSGSGNWLHEYTYSGGYDYPWGFCRDKNDNVYSGGVVNSGGSSPMFIEKYDKNGNLKWEVTVTGGGLSAMGLAADGAENVYVTGAFQSFGSPTFGSTTLTYSGSYQAMFVAKLDSNGNWKWAKLADGTGGNDGYDVGRGITVDQYANVYVTGGYYNTPTFGTITAPTQTGLYPSLFIVKYDSSGNALNVITATNAGFNNGDCCTISHIVADSCDDLYVSGYYQGTAKFGGASIASAGGTNVFVAKCSNSGIWQWANSMGGSSGASPGGITLDRNSDVYVCGQYSGGSANIEDTTISGGDAFVAKFANSSGALLWVKNQSTSGGFSAVTVDPQKYVYIAGSYNNTPTFDNVTLPTASGNTNVFVAKLDTVPGCTILPVVNASYCPGSIVNLPYTITGNFRDGNKFIAQLSDSTGNFLNAINIGSDSTTSSGTITITIPDTVPSGSTYLIRVISTNPAASSYANGCGAYYMNNVYVNDFYVSIGNNISVSITADTTIICSGGSVQLTVSDTGKAYKYKWTNNSDTASLDTTNTFTVNPTVTTTYYVTVTNGYCSGEDSVVVNTNASPPLSILPFDTLFCSGGSATLYVSSGGSDFTWSPSTGLSDTTGSSVLASPTVTTTYNVTGLSSGGCASTGSTVVTVVPSPNKPTFHQHGDTLISSSQYDNQWYFDGNMLTGDTSRDLIISLVGQYWVNVSNEANGCSTTSDTILIDTVNGINQLSDIANQLSIYPNPFNSSIFLQINSPVQDVKDWNLQITDVLGRMVYSRSSLSYRNDIDLSNLPSSVYFITVINKTGRAVFPITKQN